MREQISIPASLARASLLLLALLGAAMVTCGLTVSVATARIHGTHRRSHRTQRHHRYGAHRKRVHGRQVHHAQTRPFYGRSAHGQPLKLLGGTAINANQSNNWSGYNQGTLEQGGKLFNSITGDWTVPAATQHSSGQAEYSSDWIGIGGGCVDSGCTVTDSTLIQTGTEQDVDSSGHPSYSAWWEVIPGPSLTITSMTVHPGDRMHASIAEAVPNSNLWTITLRDSTDGQSYTTTIPYSSTHATAEWIQETPLILGTGAGFAALPSLTSPAFDLATTNGVPAKLSSSEAMDLVDSNGNVIGSPSAPDPDADGFNVCTWAGTCTAPGSS